MATPNPTHTSLVSLTQILHLAHHRNKNQHRLSKWYIHFGILRRHVGRLLSITPEHVLESRGKKLKGKSREKEMKREEELQGQVRFMLDNVVPDCYLAFSQLVADNQYATLGLMLMGCLARLYKILVGLRVVSKEEEGKEIANLEEKARIDEVGEDFGEKIVRGPIGLEMLVDEVAQKKDNETGAKPSAPKKRKQDIAGIESNVSQVPEPALGKPSKKKRKKKGDAFDDLFKKLM